MIVMEMSKKKMEGDEEVFEGGEKSFSRSVSWSTSRTSEKDDPARDSLSDEKCSPGPSLTPAKSLKPPPPLIEPWSVDEWPEAGSDDVGEWPQPLTPSAKSRAIMPGLEIKVDMLESKGYEECQADRILFYGSQCSKVADHVYLGGDCVASNKEMLQDNGITDVLNCVGFVCPEYFKNDFVYKTLWLHDDPEEDITSILYDVFDYFEDVRLQGRKVFVHCHHGISRSASLVIAYLMWWEGWTFNDAFQYVKDARGIANPNLGFACQLLQCQNRFHGAPQSPTSGLRMYRMSPYSPYDSLYLVPKMSDDPSPTELDSRGAFIIHVLSSIFVWIGQRCEPVMEKEAKAASSQVVRYEQFQGPILVVKEGDEQLDFWEAFLSAPVSKDGTKIDKEQIELAAKIAVGDRRVDEYYVDFDLFYKALTGGVVPPLSFPGQEQETLLPARESYWSILRRKLASSSRSIHSDSALL